MRDINLQIEEIMQNNKTTQEEKQMRLIYLINRESTLMYQEGYTKGRNDSEHTIKEQLYQMITKHFEERHVSGGKFRIN